MLEAAIAEAEDRERRASEAASQATQGAQDVSQNSSSSSSSSSAELPYGKEEVAKTVAYLVFANARALGVTLSKIHHFGSLCTLDFAADGLTVSILDRNQCCEIVVTVPAAKCAAYFLDGDVAFGGGAGAAAVRAPIKTALISTKHLRLYGNSCKQRQTLTLSLPAGAETVEWRLRPPRGAAGTDELHTMPRMQSHNDARDEGLTLAMDSVHMPPLVRVRVPARTFAECIDTATKSETLHSGSMRARLFASAQTGLRMRAGRYAVTLPPEGGMCSVVGPRPTAPATFSLCYLQLVMSFRDGCDDLELALAARAPQAGDKRAAGAAVVGDADAPELCPIESMPLQVTFRDESCGVSVYVMLLRHETGQDDSDDSDDDENVDTALE